ncbi:MAG: hypothetical protein ABUJ92_08315, partial [Desulfobacterales bacterium]
MKKILPIILVVFLCVLPAWGDEVDDGLPDNAGERIRTRTRAMISVGIDGDEAVKMTRMMIQNRFQNRNTLRAQQIAIDAIENGLPAEPVMNKAFEGMAKNAPEDRVVRAMEKTRDRYSHAYSYANQFTQNRDKTNDIGNALAQGFAAGMAKGDVDRTMEELRQRTRQMTRSRTEELAKESCLALRTMARLRVPSEIAADVVTMALQQKYTAQEMKQIRHLFRTRSMSVDPTKLAQHYAYAIEQGVRAGNLSNSQMGETAQTGKNSGTNGSDSSGG